MKGYTSIRIEMSEKEMKEYALKNGFNDGYEMFKSIKKSNIIFPNKEKGGLK